MTSASIHSKYNFYSFTPRATHTARTPFHCAPKCRSDQARGGEQKETSRQRERCVAIWSYQQTVPRSFHFLYRRFLCERNPVAASASRARLELLRFDAATAATRARDGSRFSTVAAFLLGLKANISKSKIKCRQNEAPFARIQLN
jgi:hypothetical protein